jgi:hypothetical protein
VLAVELREQRRRKKGEKAAEGREEEKEGSGGGGGGYTAKASALVAASLRRRGVYARPLGDVVYLMVTPVSAAGVGRGLQGALLEALDDDDE